MGEHSLNLNHPEVSIYNIVKAPGNDQIFRICYFDIFPVSFNKVDFFSCFFKNCGIIGKFRYIILQICFFYKFCTENLWCLYLFDIQPVNWCIPVSVTILKVSDGELPELHFQVFLQFQNIFLLYQ